jgi:monoamine oxidase
MARTPLLRSLARVGYRSALADTGGPYSQFPSMLSRRSLLLGSAAGAAAYALRGAEGFMLSRADEARAAGAGRVAIVGAGIAGLHAALTLQDAGVAATVFETSDRVGGRMHSNTTTWADGQTREWCGELIDTAHTLIRQLAARFSLPLVDVLAAQDPPAEPAFFLRGRYYTWPEASRDFAPVYEVIQKQLAEIGPVAQYDRSNAAAQFFDHMSITELIDRYVPGGSDAPLARLLAGVFRTENGREPDESSALTLIYPLGLDAELFGFSDERFHIAGGNQQLPEAIAAHVVTSEPPCEVRTNRRMVAIARGADGGATLAFATPDGLQEETFDQVILAIPFAVLRTLDTVHAGFDPLKRQAIAELAYGTNAKLQLQFDTRFWRGHGAWPGVGSGDIIADLDLQNGWEVTRGQSGVTGIINLYFGGLAGAGFHPSGPYTAAPESPEVTAYANRYLASLQRVWPGATAHFTGTATLSYPAADLNELGSYPSYTVGQVTSFGGYEGVPQGNIHFAGDHCSQEFVGFMEGAAREGARAAREVLADIG